MRYAIRREGTLSRIHPAFSALRTFSALAAGLLFVVPHGEGEAASPANMPVRASHTDNRSMPRALEASGAVAMGPSSGGKDSPSSGGKDSPSSGGKDSPSSGGKDSPLSGGKDSPLSGGSDVSSGNEAITARARVERISRELEQLRGRTFKEQVRIEVQTAEAFRAFIDETLDQEMPGDMAVRQSKVLQAFGLVPVGYDLRRGLTDLVVSQAGAYYRPETKTFYILMAGLPDDQLDSLILHELQHALQDQYHDLKSLREAALKNPDEDARTALQFVLEGEATFVMLKYQLKNAGQDLDRLPMEARDFVFRTVRDLDRKMIQLAAQAAKPSGPRGEEIRRSIEAMSLAPGVLFWSLYDPYFKGQYAIQRVFTEQGWAGVAGMLEHPPASTEQMLHPEKVMGERDTPTPVTTPDLLPRLGKDWALVYANTLGEAGMLSLFDEHLPRQKVAAAAGWDGDRYALYEHSSGKTLLDWASVWDDEKEAREFQEAFDQIQSPRLGGKSGVARKLQREGARVRVVIGPSELLESLLE